MKVDAYILSLPYCKHSADIYSCLAMFVIGRIMIACNRQSLYGADVLPHVTEFHNMICN